MVRNQTELKRVGNLFGEDVGTGHAGNVWDKSGVSPALTTMEGGYREPMVVVGSMQKNAYVGDESYSPTLTNAMGSGGGQVPMIVAMRGRNPEDPSDRRRGSPMEQRLEPNSDGVSNTLTTVQKDNLVLERSILKNARNEYGKLVRKEYDSHNLEAKRSEVSELQERTDGICGTITTVTKDNLCLEKIKIKQATNGGYIECDAGGVADFSYPNSEFRCGRVQGGGQISPTITAQSMGVCKVESEYRIRKLTPKECWRLMGFTDEDFEKASKVNSNSQLYKQAGNSIVVPVLEAIFRNLIGDDEDV